MKLRPYHNPQKADASVIPPKWRLLYADEFPLRRPTPCRVYVPPIGQFSWRDSGTGRVRDLTYIIPVTTQTS